MTWGLLLLNAAYAVYTASAIFKEILMLRLTLFAATVLYIAYGIVEPNLSVFLWNLPVLVLHAYAIWHLLKSRRGIDLDEEAEGIRSLLFPDLDRISYNRMWHCGEERTVHNDVLIVQGTDVEELSLIIDGEVDVVIDDKIELRMGYFRFIGEISSLADSTATATVTAHGTVRLRAWNKVELDELGSEHPRIQMAMLKAMGKDAARKLN